MNEVMTMETITNVWSGYKGDMILAQDLITGLNIHAKKFPVNKIKIKKDNGVFEGLMKMKFRGYIKSSGIKAIKFDVPELILKNCFVQYATELKTYGIRTKVKGDIVTLTVPMSIFRCIQILDASAANKENVSLEQVTPNPFGITTMYQLLTCFADQSYPRVIIKKGLKQYKELVVLYL